MGGGGVSREGPRRVIRQERPRFMAGEGRCEAGRNGEKVIGNREEGSGNVRGRRGRG